MGLFRKKRRVSAGGKKAAAEGVAHSPSADGPVTVREALLSTQLSPARQQEAREALKLGQIQLSNLESLMHRNRVQQECLSRHGRLCQELRKREASLGEARKQLASAGDDLSALQRFEAFETIYSDFLHIRLLQRMGRENGQLLVEASQGMSQAEEEHEEQRRRMTLLVKDLEERQKSLRLLSERVERIYHIQGARGILEVDISTLQGLLDTLNVKREALRGEAEELSAGLDEASQRLRELAAANRDLLPHSTMLSQGRTLLTRLDMFNNAREALDVATSELQESTLRHREQTLALEGLTAECRKADADITTLNAKLQAHRSDIAEADGHTLQERTMRQTILQRMLLSALAHWGHVSRGYHEIDEQEMKIRALRNSIETLTQQEDILEKEIKQMRAEFRTREIALAVNNTAFVKGLRADLKKGLSRVVSGTVYNPHYIETPLEEQKLVEELRIEVEGLKADIAAKESLRDKLHDEITAKATRLQILEQVFSRLHERQDRLVKEWETYSSLDPSLEGCSPDINMEAREEMIRQLMANATRSTNEAQQELDTFNFHQTSISQISQELTLRVQEKNEMSRHLTDLDTDCKVLAKHMEYLSRSRDTLQTHFSALYSEMNRTLSLPDWVRDWEAGRSAFRQRIETMVTRYADYCEELDSLEAKRTLLTSALERNREMTDFLETHIQRLGDTVAQRHDLKEKGERDLEGALDGNEEKGFFENSLQQLAAAYETANRQMDSLLTASTSLATARGRVEALQAGRTRIDNHLASQRMDIDVWINRYNAANTTVHYNELETLLLGDTDWNALRSRLRALMLSADVEQQMVDFLNGEIAALEAFMSNANTEFKELTAERLAKELAELQAQYREASLRAAANDLALRRHKHGQTQLQFEE